MESIIKTRIKRINENDRKIDVLLRFYKKWEKFFIAINATGFGILMFMATFSEGLVSAFQEEKLCSIDICIFLLIMLSWLISIVFVLIKKVLILKSDNIANYILSHIDGQIYLVSILNLKEPDIYAKAKNINSLLEIKLNQTLVVDSCFLKNDLFYKPFLK